MHAAPEQHLAVGRAQRAPRAGDIGTVVEVVAREGEPPRHLVEAVTGDEETLWFAEFLADELALEATFERRARRASHGAADRAPRRTAPPASG
jgi:hypothetical protein